MRAMNPPPDQEQFVVVRGHDSRRSLDVGGPQAVGFPNHRLSPSKTKSNYDQTAAAPFHMHMRGSVRRTAVQWYGAT